MKAALYCRLSEEDRSKQTDAEDSGSIRNQKAMLLQYAMEQGWEVYQIYSDDDYTGADRRRPAFNRLLRDAQDRKFDIVLCKTQSRFTRELELVEKYLHGLFPQWGIRFVSVVDNADTANKGNKKSRQINGLVNEWYLEDLSENIRSVLNNRRENGFHIGSFALYGYRKDPEHKGRLLVDEEAAAVVREVFLLFSQGYGKTAIARVLNDRGIPNPTEYKRLHGLRYRQPQNRGSTLWKYPAIASMLTNEIYLGNMVQGKYGSVSYKTKDNRPRPPAAWYRVEGTHEAIIDRPLWDRVQALLAQRAKPFAGGTIGLFSRKARCACCGAALRSSKSHGRHYLQCATRYVSKEACPGVFLPVALLERAVLGELRRLLAEFLDRALLRQALADQPRPRSAAERLKEELATARKRAAEASQAIRTLYRDKAKGLLSERDFAALSQEFAAERTRLEQWIREGETRLTQDACPPVPASSEDRLSRWSQPDHLTRALVELTIDKIFVGPRCPEGRRIEIHWSF